MVLFTFLRSDVFHFTSGFFVLLYLFFLFLLVNAKKIICFKNWEGIFLLKIGKLINFVNNSIRPYEEKIKIQSKLLCKVQYAVCRIIDVCIKMETACIYTTTKYVYVVYMCLPYNIHFFLLLLLLRLNFFMFNDQFGD